VVSFFYLSLFPRLISAVAEWMSTILLHMVWLSANIECRSEMCCMRLAVNTGRKFFSSPNLSRRKLGVCHTCTHGVALMRIKDAGLKRAARGSREIHDAKFRHLCAIAHLCRAISSQLRHVSTIGTKKLLICNISSRCFHDMVNFGPIAAEIGR